MGNNSFSFLFFLLLNIDPCTHLLIGNSYCRRYFWLFIPCSRYRNREIKNDAVWSGDPCRSADSKETEFCNLGGKIKIHTDLQEIFRSLSPQLEKYWQSNGRGADSKDNFSRASEEHYQDWTRSAAAGAPRWYLWLQETGYLAPKNYSILPHKYRQFRCWPAQSGWERLRKLRQHYTQTLGLKMGHSAHCRVLLRALMQNMNSWDWVLSNSVLTCSNLTTGAWETAG